MDFTCKLPYEVALVRLQKATAIGRMTDDDDVVGDAFDWCGGGEGRRGIDYIPYCSSRQAKPLHPCPWPACRGSSYIKCNNKKHHGCGGSSYIKCHNI